MLVISLFHTRTKKKFFFFFWRNYSTVQYVQCYKSWAVFLYQNKKIWQPKESDLCCAKYTYFHLTQESGNSSITWYYLESDNFYFGCLIACCAILVSPKKIKISFISLFISYTHRLSFSPRILNHQQLLLYFMNYSKE